MKYIESKRIIKSWCDDVEENCVEQAKHLAELPFTFHHVALMPDTHTGYGMPIGGVWATEGVVVPNAVGVDIGCSVSLVMTKTFANDVSKERLTAIVADIRKTIPVGEGKYPKEEQSNTCPDTSGLPKQIVEIAEHHWKFSPSIGGGNHFVELQHDQNGKLAVMMHFGSRNLGATICKHYNKLAKEINTKWYSQVEPSWGLNFLPLDSKEGQEYWQAMNLACNYAQYNHVCAQAAIIKILGNYGIKHDWTYYINHNFAKLENHFGKNVVVHRKGATQAYEKQIGIIPGSQGTASYLVEGLGNQESFKSCSHGAGRVMSRTKAVAELDLVAEQKKLDDLGILHSLHGKNDLEEAASAYKDIDLVIEQQKDLVVPINKFLPLAVIKG
jgi:tRNA-splicing ligase RtcB